jgi:hypothetical protein
MKDIRMRCKKEKKLSQKPSVLGYVVFERSFFDALRTHSNALNTNFYFVEVTDTWRK